MRMKNDEENKNHPCPLLEGRRGTVPFGCTDSKK
jgi:hypothetical protein